jgi:hypothetical protein
MRVYEDICDMIEYELEDITKGGKLNPDTLEVIGESVDIIKDITTIKAMKEASYDNGTSRDGYSNRMYYDDDYTMARGGRGDILPLVLHRPTAAQAVLCPWPRGRLGNVGRDY